MTAYQRWRRNGVILVFLGLLTLSGWYSWQDFKSQALQQFSFDQILGIETISEDQPSDTELVQVTRIIDGDTFELSDGRKVRYIGIDSPETKHPQKGVECFGQEAAEYHRQLLLDQMVRLESDVSDTDRYGRLLRYVWLDDQLINYKLVFDGYALASSYPPDVRHQELFESAQQQAMSDNVGLWAECDGSN